MAKAATIRLSQRKNRKSFKLSSFEQKKINIQVKRKEIILILVDIKYVMWAKEKFVVSAVAKKKMAYTFQIKKINSNTDLLKFLQKNKKKYYAIVLAPSHGYFGEIIENDDVRAADKNGYICYSQISKDDEFLLCSDVIQKCCNYCEILHFCCCEIGKYLEEQAKTKYASNDNEFKFTNSKNTMMKYITGYKGDIGGGNDIQKFQSEYVLAGCKQTNAFMYLKKQVKSQSFYYKKHNKLFFCYYM